VPRGTQIINGTEYVYDYVAIWDKDKKQPKHKRNYIGKMADGVFVPNKKYKLQMELEAEQKKLKTPGPVPVTESKRLFYGTTYLFDAIGQKLGLTDDLKRCFPDSYRQILSIIYYLVSEGTNPMSRFVKWAQTHVHPFGKNIPSQRCSELFGSISEDSKQNFFVLQGQRRLEKEFLAYDTTSISSYSKSLKQVKYGWNKEHDPLPQINLALLLGETSRLPVYYRKLAVNISDVKTIDKLLADIDFLQLDKVKLVMDRGFFSEANINALYQKHHKFLIAAKTSLKIVSKKLEEVRSSMVTRSHHSSKQRVFYDSHTIDWDFTETKRRSGEIIKGTRRMYLHLYYNDQRATDDKNALNRLLDNLEEELVSGNRKPGHEKLYAKYYEINKTPVRGVTITPRQDAISKAEKNYGYFALISNGVKDPLEALDIYRSKDVVEKAFGNLKERLNMRRTPVSSEENLEGKLFVQFVALIYFSYIKKAMGDKQLFKNYTMQELLDELDVIERFEQPGSKHRIGEITKKQIHLYECMGVGLPT
jgi:transposase